MYDNASLEIKCRTLWAEVLCAVESRVSAINEYMKSLRAPISCRMLGSEAVHLEQPSAQRSLVARLDLKDHAVDVNVSQGRRWTSGKRLLLAMLGDGRIYVTDGKALMGDPMAVAKLLMSVLQDNPVNAGEDPQIRAFRSWASELMKTRSVRSKVSIPVKIQSDTGLHYAWTLDMSTEGLKVQLAGNIDSGSQVTVFRGVRGVPCRVVWTQKNGMGIRAGLLCLTPPLPWAPSVLAEVGR